MSAAILSAVIKIGRLLSKSNLERKRGLEHNLLSLFLDVNSGFKVAGAYETKTAFYGENHKSLKGPLISNRLEDIAFKKRSSLPGPTQ